MLKRKLDKLLAHGMGSQLFWLLVAVMAVFAVFMLIAAIFGWNYTWQDILALFLDAGNFSGAGEHDGFRLLVTLVGVLLFSTLLISVFNNIFDNISQSAKTGATRYRMSNHILILGANHQLMPMLLALKEEKGKEFIVVMTNADVEQLSAEVETRIADKRFLNRLIYYRGAWDNLEELQSARPQFADKIYVIGEAGGTDHDSMNMRCCNFLKTLCTNAKKEIHCVVMMESGTTFDMYMKDKKRISTDTLKIDIVNAREYAAEQVLAWTWFLPVIKADDPRRSHFVILGTGGMAKAVAFTVAHNSHYSRINGEIRKTRISIVGEGMRLWMDNLAASRPGLFEHSCYTYVASDGKEERHTPERDFLDVEWEFIDMSDTAPKFRAMLEQWAADREYQVLSMALCHGKQPERIASLLHLPKVIYDKEHPTPICIYLEEGGETAIKAMETGQYGIIKPFGPAMGGLSDPLFKSRSARGILVNAIYLVGKTGMDDFDLHNAWYDSSEADKFASTYCANALVFRWVNFDPMGDREPLYEAEHRRWMMSKLLMNLEHSCIVPYDEVPQWKIDNFKNVVDGMIDLNMKNGSFPKPETC